MSKYHRAADDMVVWNGVAYKPAVRSVRLTAADLTAAALTQTINVGAVTDDDFIPLAARMSLVDAFDSPGAGSLNVELGVTGDTDAFIVTFDAYTGSAFEGTGWEAGTPNAAPAIGFPMSNTQIVVLLTATTDNLDQFTNGDLTIEVYGWEIDAQ